MLIIDTIIAGSGQPDRSVEPEADTLYDSKRVTQAYTLMFCNVFFNLAANRQNFPADHLSLQRTF
jgi:hypothetical protein